MKNKLITICVLLILIFTSLSVLSNTSSKVDSKSINVLKDVSQEFDFPLHSNSYMLVDLSDFKILYAHKNDIQIYPASLTKVMTLATVLDLCEDLDDVSFVSNQQVEDLIVEDASIAELQRDYDYTIRDLLYALILPSGADAALALENYFAYRGIDLVKQMNIHAQEIGCTNTHFMNSTGLHDDDHYTSLDDLYLIVMDTLKHEEGRAMLSSLYYQLEDGLRISTGVRMVARTMKADVLGGKTGYTDEAGQNIIVLYRNKGRSFVLLLANAMGKYSNDEYWHFDDALEIFDQLY